MKSGERNEGELVLFFKQMAACDIRLSLVGSEMCMRDRAGPHPLSAGLYRLLRSAGSRAGVA